ncbi:LPS biosynthesis glycosyltransferase [Massilia violaceinigra]|uniref:LPS biosynthesis glycosyltransferase n=1 Tax=Massilia violaceinigra TaxID=2045208 RepID=A0A2D2DDV9_9BURK|nr:glycosyltransferase family 9 protein [Massilia violaceinigra]ATQ73143.1 LPS biosynthesis glycosyltransferase [Massilia violaceinigra]
MTTSSWLARHDHTSVVIFRALQLGDMLCAVPALRALRAAMPRSRISLVGLPWADQFARRFSAYVDEFIAFPGHEAFPEQPARLDQLHDFYASMRARRFDLALQMHGNGQYSNAVVRAFGARAMAGFGAAPGRGDECLIPFPDTGAEPLRLLELATGLGAPACGPQLEFPITAADERELEASGVARGLAPGSYVCIHPGARYADKCWPAKKFAAVADQLAIRPQLKTVLTGSPAEVPLTAAVARLMRRAPVDAAGPLSIGAMAALMSRARLLICNDTGVSHIAAGLRLRSVVIFSKADIRRWAPLDQQLHRCLWDPFGEQAKAVLDQARALLMLR